MALKETVHQMNHLLEAISKDLGKTGKLNKAAAQRVRTGTIKFAKVAKIFRKESIAAEKGGHFKRKRKASKQKSPGSKKGSAKKAAKRR